MRACSEDRERVQPKGWSVRQSGAVSEHSLQHHPPQSLSAQDGVAAAFTPEVKACVCPIPVGLARAARDGQVTLSLSRGQHLKHFHLAL